MRLDGQVAIMTGSCRGIGWAIALRFAEASVGGLIVNDIDGALAAATVSTPRATLSGPWYDTAEGHRSKQSQPDESRWRSTA